MVAQFYVLLEYESPDYWLELPVDTKVELRHSNGTLVAFGYAAERQLRALTLSEHRDEQLLALIEGAQAESEAESDDDRLVEFSAQLKERHREAAEDVMSTLRWMLIRPGGRRPVLRRLSARYRTEDRADWVVFPMRRDAPVLRLLDQLPVTESWRGAIAAAVANGRREPLAHELLREAEDALDSNPRSAIVLMLTTLEAGLKRQPDRVAEARRRGTLTPSRLQPARRAFQPVLTGDVARLLTAAANLEPARWRELPGWVSDRIERGRLARNAVVHEGASPPSREFLQELRRAIQDVLYLLDFQAGEDWALQYVDFEQGDVAWGTPVFGAVVGED